MNLLIPLTAEEEAFAAAYAKTHCLSLEEAFKKALFRQIEDEEDQRIADGAYKEYIDCGCQLAPIEELWKELDSRK